MTSQSPSSSPRDEMTHLEGIRKRAPMYVGSTGFFGFINYLVCPFALLLANRPRWITATIGDDGFVIESDACVTIEPTDDGCLVPFEHIASLDHGHSLEGCVLAALSEELVVCTKSGGECRTLNYQFGKRISQHVDAQDGTSTVLRFKPDQTVFSVTNISPAIFQSYLRRMSYLHCGVRFRLSIGDEAHEYFSATGIRGLFDSISAPYQLLHEPIHIVTSEQETRLELVFAFQSWKEKWMWCFVNNGRAVEGGTHEKGLHDAFNALYSKLKLPQRDKSDRNGVVALMSLTHPKVVWEGCIKGRIANPELRELVKRLVIEKVVEWVENRPDVLTQLMELETFQFPDSWYS